MKKRKTKNRKNSLKAVVPERKTLKHHIKHKSRLTLLLIIKLVVAFVFFYIVRTLHVSFGSYIVDFIAIAVLFALYLFLIIKVLHLLKF